MSLNDEFKIIETIRKTIGRPSRRVTVGIGDDAAVVKAPKSQLVATVDTLVEGVHFDLTYTTPRELGAKALAVNLSDLAAMGAKPLYALVSLGLRQEYSEVLVTELMDGMRVLAKKYDVDIIGGNLSQSPTAMIVDVSAMGEAGKYTALRSAARVGQLIGVTGELGSSAAGLLLLKRQGRGAWENYRTLLTRHLSPEPRVKEGIALAECGGLGAMIDISDGLSRELHHLAHHSKVGLCIEENLVPILPDIEKAAKELSSNARAWALYGGEDYELLFTIDPKSFPRVQKKFKSLGTRVTIIGQVEKKKGVRIKNPEGQTVMLQPMGWNHFVRRGRPS